MRVLPLLRVLRVLEVKRAMSAMRVMRVLSELRVMDVMRAMSVMHAMCAMRVKRVLRVMRVYPSESRTQICLPFPTERVDFGDNECGYRFWTWQEAFGKPMLVRSYKTAFKAKASKADSVAKA